MKVPAKYRWIVESIGARRRTEADQARLVISWLVAFLLRLGVMLEEADACALESFCQRASARRNHVSMNRLVYTIRNVYAELRAHGWIEEDPSRALKWGFDRERRRTLEVDLASVEKLLDYVDDQRAPGATEETVRNLLIAQLAVDAGASCGELSGLNHVDLGTGCAVRIGRGTVRERIARLSLKGSADCVTYLQSRRDLFGLGSEALFVSTRGARERLPLRSVADIIQSQIDAAGLTDLLTPADLGRYAASKLLSEGASPQDALLVVGLRRIAGQNRSNPVQPGIFKGLHPLHE